MNEANVDGLAAFGTTFSGMILLFVFCAGILIYTIISILVPIYIYFINKRVKEISETLMKLAEVIEKSSLDHTEQLRDVNLALKNFNEPIQQLRLLGQTQEQANGETISESSPNTF